MMECQKQQAELQHSLQFQSQQERLFGHFPRFPTSSSSFSSFQTSIRTSHANEEFPMRNQQTTCCQFNESPGLVGVKPEVQVSSSSSTNTRSAPDLSSTVSPVSS